MLVDIVSKNGNLLINIVQTPEGDLEPDVLKIVQEIGMWTSVNGEGIYGSRPWKVYGEKPAAETVVKSGSFNEDELKYTGQDIRFTTKGDTLYAFCLGEPRADILINSLGKNSKLSGKKIVSVSLLGSNEKLHWKQEKEALLIKKSFKIPVKEVPVVAFKIVMK